MSAKRTLVVIAGCLLALLIAAVLLLLRPDSPAVPAAGAVPPDTSAPPDVEPAEPQPFPAETAGVSEEAPGEAEFEVDAMAADTALNALNERITEKVDREARRWEVLSTIEEYHRLEDEVYEQVARYGEVKDSVRKAALAALAARSISLEDTEALLAAARDELDAFWDRGSLGAPEAYANGYLARAMAELALEKDPENFELLSMLRESISSTMPQFFAGYKRNGDALAQLWPVLEKQKALIDSGKVPPSPEVMLAMYDWTSLARAMTGDNEAAVGGWEWMVENADTCGWSKMKPLLEKGLEVTRQGSRFGTNLYAWPAASREELLKVLARFSRGLPSQKGSREYRERATRVWEKYDELSHSE